MDKEVVALQELITAGQNIVVFTGAGISTESGIPDFRGPQGVWKTQTPIDFSDFIASEEWRRESWRRKFTGENKMAKASPNSGHYAISHWASLGKVSHVITQNVDGLHQQSGIPDEQITELHGNANYASCLDCGKRYELPAIRDVFLADDVLPSCEDCHVIIKTATISFGQAMPIAAMQRAEQATLACDTFIAIGSSLTVYPAAGFPVLAKQNQAKLIIINNQDTDLDPIADLVLHRPIGITLSSAAGIKTD